MTVSCQLSREGNTATLTITPPFGWTSLPPCLDEIQHLGAVEALRVDISSLEQLDNAGIGILLLLRKQAAEKGIAIRLAAPRSLVNDILMLSKLDQLFQVDHETEADLNEVQLP
jgi:anti-anti-sigma factor